MPKAKPRVYDWVTMRVCVRFDLDSLHHCPYYSWNTSQSLCKCCGSTTRLVMGRCEIKRAKQTWWQRLLGLHRNWRARFTGEFR